MFHLFIFSFSSFVFAFVFGFFFAFYFFMFNAFHYFTFHLHFLPLFTLPGAFESQPWLRASFSETPYPAIWLVLQVKLRVLIQLISELRRVDEVPSFFGVRHVVTLDCLLQ